MSFIRKLTGFLQQRSQYRHAVSQLSSMTDRQLSDIGISRSDIYDVVHKDMIRKSAR